LGGELSETGGGGLFMGTAFCQEFWVHYNNLGIIPLKGTHLAKYSS